MRHKRQITYSIGTCMIVVCMLAGVSVAEAKEAARIAIVQSRSLKPYAEAVHAIRDDFVGVDAEVYNLEDFSKSKATLVEKVKNIHPDLIFTVGTEAHNTFRSALASVPHVAAMVYDTDELLKENEYAVLLRVSYQEQFALLRQLLPNLSSLTVVYTPHMKKTLSEIQVASRVVGLPLTEIPLEDVSDIKMVFDDIASHTECLLMVLDPDLYTQAVFKKLIMISIKEQFPVVTFSPNYVRAGALISFSTTYYANGSHAASVGKRVLRGNQSVPHIMNARDMHVALNEHIAKKIGIIVPEDIKKEVDEFVV